MNPSEFNPMDPALENAVREIRDDSVDPAVVEAAAARVWAKLQEQAPASRIRNCADFQALLPDYRAGKLAPARATLLKDHLHECVACRRVYEGKVVTLPTAAAPRRVTPMYKWAVAAAIVAAAGIAFYMEVDSGTGTGRALVQTVNGNLYEISASGIRPLAAGQELADGVEIRTAKDSTAMLELRDGSVVELRERSGLTTSQSAADLTVHLDRGSIIVQAAKRRKGHLYVATGDCRVAVTGTVFSVTSGLKGSRVAVVEGEVRVSQNNEEKVLHPGDTAVTSINLEPLSVKEEISWSRNRDKLSQQLDRLQRDLQKIHLPGPRYSSKLLDRLPANTVFYASIPNLGQYLGEAQEILSRSLRDNPELNAMWAGNAAVVQPVIEKLRTASEYLGEEVVIASVGSEGRKRAPVLLAEMKSEGFVEFLKKQVPLTVETRGGIVVFGPEKDAVQAMAAVLDTPAGGFAGTPFHARIRESYDDGAGFLICADLSQSRSGDLGKGNHLSYFIACQKEVNNKTELRASIGFEGERSGMAAWLATPAPMGSLDYVSPEATLVTAFVVSNPGAIIEQLTGVARPLLRSPESSSLEPNSDLSKSLGGEFSLSVDGPLVPVPSWKVVAEVYDPAAAQATVQKLADAYSAEAIKRGDKPLRTARETVEGRDYYMIAGGDPNPLTEVHYTFANGYLIAGPSRAGIQRALQVKASGTSIRQSAQFVAMQPRDHYASFSALVYQNLGKTLAPLAGLIGAFVPQREGGPNMMRGISDMKPTLIAAYGEPDRITVAGSGDVFFHAGMSSLLRGDLSSIVGSAIPMRQLVGTRGR